MPESNTFPSLSQRCCARLHERSTFLIFIHWGNGMFRNFFRSEHDSVLNGKTQKKFFAGVSTSDSFPKSLISGTLHSLCNSFQQPFTYVVRTLWLLTPTLQTKFLVTSLHHRSLEEDIFSSSWFFKDDIDKSER